MKWCTNLFKAIYIEYNFDLYPLKYCFMEKIDKIN